MADKSLFDTSDIDRWIGVPIGGGEIIEDIHVNDIRRWAQAMQNPNPLHYDRAWAAESRFGRILAPQSFTVNCTWGHGAEPSIQGVVPGTHMLFGGDEWWFFGPRIAPGDVFRNDKMLFDYRVRDTAFAGPTIFSRGDTSYFNQRGELVAKQRSTSIRYLAEEAQKRVKEEEKVEPVWSDEDLARVEEEKMDYYKSFLDLGHDKRLFVRKGDALPRRPIGPHTTQTFTSEWRAYLFTVWGASNYDMASSSTERAGWLPEMDQGLRRGQGRPGAHRRPVHRPFARPHDPEVRPADRHAARLRLRRVDGRLVHRLTFFDPHVTYGMTSAFEPIHMLQKMPFHEVMRMSLLGNRERLSAKRAYEIGLVSEVVPREKLREAADWAARVIASQPPLAIQGTLRAIWAGQELTRSQALSMAYAYVSLGTSPASIQEGQKAFASKKRPPWKMR